MTNCCIDEITSQLLRVLPTLSLASQQLTRFSYVLDNKSGFPGLSWLAAQDCYPQFYWSQRTCQEEASAIGAVQKFRSVAEAEDFILKYPQYADMRIWGLNGWDAIDSQLVSSADQETAFFFLPRIEFYRDGEQQWLTFTIMGQEDLAQAAAFLQSLQPDSEISPINAHIIAQKHTPDHNEWCRLLELAIDEMRADKMEKVVMARQTDLTLSQPLSAVEFLNASQQVNHQCYHFMLALDSYTGFISSTPERLYLREGVHLLTEALAGTVASSDDDQIAAQNAKWLMEDSKNQHENLVVLDDICQQLQGTALAVDVSVAEVIRLRKVQHLRRSISAELLSTSDRHCLSRLQPTAAVSGLPRINARRFLAQHEPFSRGWYAGSGGVISQAKSEFAVSLRCALICGEHIRLYAGAGIVSDSDPEQEWQEIENKASGLISLLNKAQ